MNAFLADRAATRVRRAAEAIQSPGDAGLAVRMLGWALVLPMLKHAAPLATLVRLMVRRPGRNPRNPDRERRIGHLARIAHRIAGAGRRDNCLERSLIAYRYLSAANAGPRLVIGARHGVTGIEGHAWVLVDGEPVHDSDDDLRDFVALAAFDRAGWSGSSRRWRL